MNPRYLALWLLWAAFGAALEATALANTQPGDTLSELARLVLGSHPIVWWAGLGMMAWLVQHWWLGRR